MEWNVFRINVNARKVEQYNIFNHYTFRKYCAKIVKDELSRDEAYEQLKRELMYYFWCKVEWEIWIENAFDDKSEYTKKVDVYTQVMMNYDKFFEYFWNNKDELKKETFEY